MDTVMDNKVSPGSTTLELRDIELATPRQESLPLEDRKQLFIECNDLTYSIKPQGKKESKTLLNGVSCMIPPRRLVALMGPSGAGKTTLLNVLAGRGSGKMGGSLTLNSRTLTRALMRRECKVVPQYDNLIAVLTARETLTYTAELALALPATEREDAVNKVIDQLSLTSCADVICGDSDVKGLSGGQAKRVSMAAELLSNPGCLLLDEPTSGLDSKVAEDVVDVMKALARGGRTIICTIHQPSFQVFEKFDWLVMLDKGRVAYNGEAGQLSEYLAEVGKPCPGFVNPADHFMQLLSEEPVNGLADWSQVFAQSSFGKLAEEDHRNLKQRRDAYVSSTSASPTKTAVSTSSTTGFPNSLSSQIGTLFRRSVVVTIRDKAQLRTRLMQVIFIGILVSAIYWRMPMTQDRAQDRLSVMFLVLLMMGMSTIMATALLIPIEKTIMLREYKNGYYPLVAYVFGRVSVLELFQVFYSLAFASVTYYALGLNPGAENFAIYLATVTIVSLISGLAGVAAGVIFPTPQAASAATPMVLMPLVIFAGLFIPYSSIPSYFIWLYYLSFFQYAVQILMVNEFDSRFLEPCSEANLQIPGMCPYGTCNPSNVSAPLPCSGDLVLQKLDYDPSDLPANFAILAAFTLGLAMLCYALLSRFVYTNR